MPQGRKTPAPPHGWPIDQAPAPSWRKVKETRGALHVEDYADAPAIAKGYLRPVSSDRAPGGKFGPPRLPISVPAPKTHPAPPLPAYAPSQRKDLTGAARQKRLYRRRQAGLEVFSIEGDGVGIAELLIAAGLLAPGQDSHGAVEQALQGLLRVMVEDHRASVTR